MISLKHLRSFFLTMSLVVILTITIAFSFGATESWATVPIKELIGQPKTQIATMPQAEGIVENIKDKAQEVIGSMTNEPKTQGQTDKESKEFKAKTLEGVEEGIVNPNYQPGGKTKQLEKEDSKNTGNIKSQARDTFR